MSSYSEERFTTGSFGLDLIMDGGWKRGAINEVWGLPGSGKTILMKQTLQHRHIKDKVAMWVDTGPGNLVAKDPSLLYTTPTDAEQTFYLMECAAAYGYHKSVPSFIIVDDANHLIRQAELDGDPDYVPHPQREYKEELWSLKDSLTVNNTGVIFISQPRDNQRPPIRGTGISEQAAERISLKVVKQPQDGEILVQATRKATGYSTQYWVVPGKGIDRTRELIQYGLRTGIVQVIGSWYHCPFIMRNRKWHGAAEFQDFLDNDLDSWMSGRFEERIAQKWAERTKE
jgi:RecA/RadA recombinase